MPETWSSAAMLWGAARTMFSRLLSEKTMKAGLPVLAASALRQSRRRASRSFCAGVKLGASRLTADLAPPADRALEDLVAADLRDLEELAPAPSLIRRSGAWRLPLEAASRPS